MNDTKKSSIKLLIYCLSDRERSHCKMLFIFGYKQDMKWTYMLYYRY